MSTGDPDRGRALRAGPSLIHLDTRATQKLWTFCTGGGAHVQATATMLEWLREQDELPDWWEQGSPRRARR